jgi:3-dehydroquinate dehydratase
MSGDVMVLLPHGTLPEDAAIPAGCRVVEWRGLEDVVPELATAGAHQLAAVVFESDGLRGDDVPAVVEAVQGCAVPVVEVRGNQWDGFTRLELAEACKGVVSGFGVEGVWAVAEALRS